MLWNLRRVSSGEKKNGLPLVEEFYTLQGEGYHTGRAAWFIRLGGCDVGCSWCDSREAWNPRVHPPVEVDEIVRRAADRVENPARAVVVTGGEPLMWPLDGLCDGLHAAGVEIFLETSGSHPFSGSFDWVCLSPKRRQPPLEEAWARADELKVIVEGAEDLKWAEECAEAALAANSGALADGGLADGARRPKLFLQPEWSRREAVIPMLVEYIKKNPRWRMSLQSHKYMRIP
jgi:organic radical activating enzyme